MSTFRNWLKRQQRRGVLLGRDELAGWFGHEARRVYDALGDSDDERELRRLVGWIQARGGTTFARELQQSGPTRYRGRSEDAEAALNQLVTSGVGSWFSVNPGGKGRASNAPLSPLRCYETQLKPGHSGVSQRSVPPSGSRFFAV